MLNNKKSKESKPSYWQRTTKDFWKKFFYLLAIVWLSKAGYILGFTYSGILLGILLAIIGGALGITLVNLISLKIFKYKSSDLFLRIDLLDENKNNQTHVSIQKDKLNFIIFVGILCVINIAGSSVFLSNNNKTEQPETEEISLVNKHDLNDDKKTKQSDHQTQLTENLPSNNFDQDVMQVLSKEFNDQVISILRDKNYDLAINYAKSLETLYVRHQISNKEFNSDVYKALNENNRKDLALHYFNGITFLMKKYNLEVLPSEISNLPSPAIQVPQSIPQQFGYDPNKFKFNQPEQTKDVKQTSQEPFPNVASDTPTASYKIPQTIAQKVSSTINGTEPPPQQLNPDIPLTVAQKVSQAIRGNQDVKQTPQEPFPKEFNDQIVKVLLDNKKQSLAKKYYENINNLFNKQIIPSKEFNDEIVNSLLSLNQKDLAKQYASYLDTIASQTHQQH